MKFLKKDFFKIVFFRFSHGYLITRKSKFTFMTILSDCLFEKCG